MRRGSEPITIPAIKADPSLIPVVGSYLVGDIVRVRGGGEEVPCSTSGRPSPTVS